MIDKDKIKVGTKVEAYWDETDEYFPGTVKKVIKGKGEYSSPSYEILFDDGDKAIIQQAWVELPLAVSKGIKATAAMVGNITEAAARKLNPKFVEDILKCQRKAPDNDMGYFSYEPSEGRTLYISDDHQVRRGMFLLHYRYSDVGPVAPGFMLIRVTSKTGSGDYTKVRISNGDYSWRADGDMFALVNQ